MIPVLRLHQAWFLWCGKDRHGAQKLTTKGAGPNAERVARKRKSKKAPLVSGAQALTSEVGGLRAPEADRQLLHGLGQGGPHVVEQPFLRL